MNGISRHEGQKSMSIRTRGYKDCKAYDDMLAAEILVTLSIFVENLLDIRAIV